MVRFRSPTAFSFPFAPYSRCSFTSWRLVWSLSKFGLFDEFSSCHLRNVSPSACSRFRQTDLADHLSTHTDCLLTSGIDDHGGHTNEDNTREARHASLVDCSGVLAMNLNEFSIR